ncbi:unnamed protein product, partial [marine sediment metagenome]
TKLPPGMYELALVGQQRQLAFKGLETNHDELVDIPNPSHEMILKEMELFLQLETKAKFKKHGYLHKRSAILHGLPGTGKTCIINRIAAEVIEQGGVVIFNPDIRFLKDAFQQLTSIQPETQTMVILEEFDSYIHHFESELLSLLDGEVQKDNVIFLATTNYFEEIPPRILRPGRFPSIIEVGMPTAKARTAFLKAKTELSDKDIKIWVKKTDELSIDELSECIKACLCLNYELEDIVKRIRDLQALCAKDSRQKHHSSRIRRDIIQDSMEKY